VCSLMSFFNYNRHYLTLRINHIIKGGILGDKAVHSGELDDWFLYLA